jgi:multicomponent Na+:H+ antiporter subunit C
MPFSLDNFDFFSFELFPIILFFISFYGLIIMKKAIKSIVFILIMQTAVVIFYLGIGYIDGIRAPIGDNLQDIAGIADPLPQALMLTAIVISISVVAINITMLMEMIRKHKTSDWDALKEKS